jgi:hypothetical protein
LQDRFVLRARKRVSETTILLPAVLVCPKLWWSRQFVSRAGTDGESFSGILALEIITPFDVQAVAECRSSRVGTGSVCRKEVRQGVGEKVESDEI